MKQNDDNKTSYKTIYPVTFVEFNHFFTHYKKRKQKKRRETNLNESNFLVLFDKINFYIKPTKNKNKNRIETEENPRKRKVRFTSRVF